MLKLWTRMRYFQWYPTQLDGVDGIIFETYLLKCFKVLMTNLSKICPFHLILVHHKNQFFPALFMLSQQFWRIWKGEKRACQKLVKNEKAKGVGWVIVQKFDLCAYQNKKLVTHVSNKSLVCIVISEMLFWVIFFSRSQTSKCQKRL